MTSRESRLKSIASTSRKTSSIRTRATKSLVINLEDLAEPLVAIPPDGGWGWVVVAASFIVMFCVDGIGYCFAIFFEDISNDLHCEITDVALVSSILGGFYYLAGPLTCSAINRFGFQVIGVTGGVVALVSFAIGSFMNSILPFAIIIGFVGGTAFNLAYTPSVLAIGFYFEKWRALAMAINCCGSSLGVMIVPLIMTNLFERFTWRTKFRIISGVFGFCAMLGFTYRPIKTTRIEKNVQFLDVSREEQSESTIATETEINIPGGFAGIFQRFRNALFPTISEVSVYTPSRYTSTSGVGYYFQRRETEPETLSTFMRFEDGDEFMDLKSTLNPVEEEGSNNEIKGCCKNCWRKCSLYCSNFGRCCKCCTCCVQRPEDFSLTTINRPLYREDIFYTGSIYRLSEYSKVGESRIPQPSLQKPDISLNYTLSVSRAPTQRDLQQQAECVLCPEAFVRVLATMLHFQMLKSPTFILLLISGYLSLMATYICYTYIPGRAIEMGIDRNSATLLLSILGVANTIGRAMCGVVSCFPVDINVISWVAIGIGGSITLASVFMPTFTGQIIFCCIFGFTIAAFAVLRAIMFVELFGIENLTNCFGLNMVFASAAAFSGIPIANFLYSYTESFKTPFIFTGIIIIISAILLIPIRLVLKWEQRNVKKVTFDS